MSGVRKYQEGAPIESLSEAVGMIQRDEYIMVRGRPTHPAWLRSQSLALLAGQVRGRAFARAVITEEWRRKHGG